MEICLTFVCIEISPANLVLELENQKNIFSLSEADKRISICQTFCIMYIKVNNFLDSNLWFGFFNSAPFGGFCLWLWKFKLCLMEMMLLSQEIAALSFFWKDSFHTQTTEYNGTSNVQARQMGLKRVKGIILEKIRSSCCLTKKF